MIVRPPNDLSGLAGYIEPFLELAGRDRWFRRADHFDREQGRSPYRWKIVADYHWLEMAVAFQADVLAKEARLLPELADELILASLNFAATTVEVSRKLNAAGRKTLEGRIRDALKAETGFAALFQELDLAQRLMDRGYDVDFVDMEGSGRFDFLFSKGDFAGEVECKSISADAGRQVHRKDFYRFMEDIAPALSDHLQLSRQEVLLITLKGRLPPGGDTRSDLIGAVEAMAKEEAPAFIEGSFGRLERLDFKSALGGAPVHDSRAFYKACGAVFGDNTHVSGALSETGGFFVVMRSVREDDTSKPMLESMRKAATQFTGTRPSFIAIQEHGITAADLMLPHLRRQVGILSYALFGHYGGDHVNATYVTGFGAVVKRGEGVGTPAFAVSNPSPRFAVEPEAAAPFFEYISDEDFAAAIGAPLPAPNISKLSIGLEDDAAEN